DQPDAPSRELDWTVKYRACCDRRTRFHQSPETDQRPGTATQTDLSPVMWLRLFVGMVFIAATSAPVAAAPFVPESDNQVLERLPFTPSDPVLRRLRGLNSQLIRSPDNLPLAILIAQGYLELGRVTGDPRYGGYAQAALAAWWDAAEAPQEVLVL